MVSSEILASDNGQHAQDEATYAKQQEPERQVLQLCALNAPWHQVPSLHV